MSDYLSSPTEAENSYTAEPAGADDGYLAAPAPSLPSAPANPTMAPPPGDWTTPPMQPAPIGGSEFTIQAPFLEELPPNRHTVGARRGDLSPLLLDVEVAVEVCFGDAALSVEEFLDLAPGSVVELDRSIETPIELRVRGKLVATGQLVTIDGSYGLRITSTVERH